MFMTLKFKHLILKTKKQTCKQGQIDNFETGVLSLLGTRELLVFIYYKTILYTTYYFYILSNRLKVKINKTNKKYFLIGAKNSR